MSGPQTEARESNDEPRREGDFMTSAPVRPTNRAALPGGFDAASVQLSTFDRIAAGGD